MAPVYRFVSTLQYCIGLQGPGVEIQSRELLRSKRGVWLHHPPLYRCIGEYEDEVEWRGTCKFLHVEDTWIRQAEGDWEQSTWSRVVQPAASIAGPSCPLRNQYRLSRRLVPANLKNPRFHVATARPLRPFYYRHHLYHQQQQGEPSTTPHHVRDAAESMLYDGISSAR